MAKSTSDLQSLLKLGGGVIIDAASKSSSDLKSMAKLSASTGGKLILRNASSKSLAELQSIAKIATDNVIFEF